MHYVGRILAIHQVFTILEPVALRIVQGLLVSAAPFYTICSPSTGKSNENNSPNEPNLRKLSEGYRLFMGNGIR